MTASQHTEFHCRMTALHLITAQADLSTRAFHGQSRTTLPAYQPSALLQKEQVIAGKLSLRSRHTNHPWL